MTVQRLSSQNFSCVMQQASIAAVRWEKISLTYGITSLLPRAVVRSSCTELPPTKDLQQWSSLHQGSGNEMFRKLAVTVAFRTFWRHDSCVCPAHT